MENQKNSTALPIDDSDFSQSSDIGKLFEALSKAQGEMKPAVMDMKNPHYGSFYASLTSCKESYQAPLAMHGLCVTQQVFSDDRGYFIKTVLGHSSGQWISCEFKLLIDKQNMQGLGSAITYARRYGVNALVGVVDTEDDDGEAAIANPPAKAAIKPKVEPKPDTPTQPQLVRLFAMADEFGWTHEQIKEYLLVRWQITSTKLLTLTRYNALFEVINSKSFEKACATILDEPKV